jgi:antitoxin YefM
LEPTELPLRIPLFEEYREGATEADADIAIITRRDGADAVVMSLAQYQSMAETLHLLSSPSNAAHLAESIAQYRAGQARRRALVPE